MNLSVIVPVYNVEKFLPRCLDSLFRQGMKSGEWEIICVNDGSPDNSAIILAEYEKKYPDIFKVITQENQGLGGARNAGTAMAQGEYVTYLDSDDYLIDGAYRYLLDHFCQDKPDVLCFGYRNVCTDGISIPTPHIKPDGKVTFDGDGAEAYNRFPLPFVWAKFYKRSFLETHDIQSEIVICQDEVFNFEVFRLHPRTRIVSCPVCCYEQGNLNSIQKTINKEKVLVQLNDLYYNIALMKTYLQLNTTLDMEPAARRNINNFLNIYNKKLLSVFLSRDEWKRYTHVLRIERQTSVYGDTFVGNAIAFLKNMAGHSYSEYLFVHFFHRHIFFKYILPRM